MSMRKIWLLTLVWIGLAGCQARPVYPQTLSTPEEPSTATPAPLSTATATARPTPDAVPEPVCQPESGQVIRENVSTARRGASGRALVYLPPCYQSQTDRAYPVLYLLHGQTYDETQWLDLGVVETADALIRAGSLPPLIIVLPYDATWQPPAEDPFDEWLIEDLLPAIDARYRTLPGARHRALGGLSRGAGWSIHLGLQRPDLFGVLGWHSPAIFWGDAPRIPRWLAAIPDDWLPQVYLDIGDRDPLLDNARQLETWLTERGVPHSWRLYPGYHEAAYWGEHLADYLRWYGQALCRPPEGCPTGDR